MPKKDKRAAKASADRVVELRAKADATRKRRERAREQARAAKQRAKEARRLFKDARKIAKRAKEELAVLTKKLKKLMQGAPERVRVERDERIRRSRA
jgi:uncharacterized FlaG/YvyC family protein